MLMICKCIVRDDIYISTMISVFLSKDTLCIRTSTQWSAFNF